MKNKWAGTYEEWASKERNIELSFIPITISSLLTMMLSFGVILGLIGFNCLLNPYGIISVICAVLAMEILFHVPGDCMRVFNYEYSIEEKNRWWRQAAARCNSSFYLFLIGLILFILASAF